MAVSEELRHRIREAFRASHGDEVANGLMELLPPVGWADVATKHDVAVLRSDLVALEERIDLRFERMEATFDGRFARIDERFERMEATFDGRFALVDAKFARVDEKFETLRADMRATLEEQTTRCVKWLAVVAAFTVAAAEALGRFG